MPQFKPKQVIRLHDNYNDIFSKHATDSGKTNLVPITLIPKASIKP